MIANRLPGFRFVCQLVLGTTAPATQPSAIRTPGQHSLTKNSQLANAFVPDTSLQVGLGVPVQIRQSLREQQPCHSRL